MQSHRNLRLTAVPLAITAIAAALAFAAPAAAQNAKALREAAERALNKERFCEAVHLYTKLDEIQSDPENIVQAAEAADRADDRVRALALYKALLAKAPKHPRARAAERAVPDLEKRIQRGGNGTACAVPRAECGNGLVESGETCDDGNTSDGDVCPRTCQGAGAAAPVTAPKTTPVVTPPVVTPPVVTPPVKPVVTPPVVTPPVVTPKEEPKTAPAASATSGELCTLLKPIKVFVKGEWKTIDFGSTITIKTTGIEFSKVETPSGEGKVSSVALDSACAPPDESAGGAAAAGAGAGAAAGSSFKLEEPTPVTTPKEEPKPKEDIKPKEEPKTVTPPDEPKPTVIEDQPKPTVDEPKPDAKPETIEPLRREDDPAATAPAVEEGGGGIGGWLMAGAGVAVLAGGATAGVFGALPYLQHQSLCGASLTETSCPAQDDARGDYVGANDDEERADAASDAESLKTDIDNAAQEWDDRGRWLLVGGSVGAGVGVALAVGGIVWALAGGAEEEEGE